MNFKKILPFLLLLVLAALAIGIRQCKQVLANKTSIPSADVAINQPRGLNRNPSHINYSKHAKCRMACRHIDEAEITDMLKNGIINYKKSQLQGEDCRKKYAVEGFSKNRQHLRLIFAPCGDEMTVVTCIDLDQEWTCDCK